MIKNKTLLITSLLCLIPAVAGLFLWKQLPQQIAVHFTFDGAVNRYAPKLSAILMIPIVCCIANFIIHFATKFDSRNKKQTPKVLSIVVWILPIIACYAQVLILIRALGHDVNITKTLFLLLGFLFVVLGNYLPKVQQNHTIGIRLPWTLSNSDNWRKTHRFGGFLWSISGILVIARGAFLPKNNAQLDVLFFIVFFPIIVLLPILYSWIISKKG